MTPTLASLADEERRLGESHLDRARQAFDAWAAQYEHGSNPERHVGAAPLLEALHACGVDALPTRSMWKEIGERRVVELVCFADGDWSEIAVYREGAENRWVPRLEFLARFKPLAGER